MILLGWVCIINLILIIVQIGAEGVSNYRYFLDNSILILMHQVQCLNSNIDKVLLY
jgi:hypothetical protein